MELESLRKEIELLPMTVTVLRSLIETSRLQSTHYSTMIEGNMLTQEEVKEVVLKDKTVGRERDEKEVLGYYKAISWLEKEIAKNEPLTQNSIKQIHAIVMGAGKIAKPTPYREGQNVIKDSKTRKIIYLPPEAKDVPGLMKELIDWLDKADKNKIPVPIQAAILDYQFATIHPYFDGNGRTARLLATYLLRLKGYGLKGIYSLDEYYAKNLPDYYESISIGSHNYYRDRADSDITPWLEYFCKGMVESFRNVIRRAVQAQSIGEKDESEFLKQLNDKQRKVLTLFKKRDFITSADIQKLLKISPRSARNLAQQWVENGFIKIANSAKKTRSYTLNKSC